MSGVSVGLACARPLDIMLSLLGSHRRTLGERIPGFGLGLENWLLGGDGLKVVRTEAGEQGGGRSSRVGREDVSGGSLETKGGDRRVFCCRTPRLGDGPSVECKAGEGKRRIQGSPGFGAPEGSSNPLTSQGCRTQDFLSPGRARGLFSLKCQCGAWLLEASIILPGGVGLTPATFGVQKAGLCDVTRSRRKLENSVWQFVWTVFNV